LDDIYEKHLEVFITVQIFVGNTAVDLIENLNILHLWLENTYSCPTNVFGVCDPTKWGALSTRPPKRHILAGKHVI